MQPSDIQVGTTYRCRSGWIRRVVKVRFDGFVTYQSWQARRRDRPPSLSSGHMDWFSSTALAVDTDAVMLPNGDRG